MYMKHLIIFDTMGLVSPLPLLVASSSTAQSRCRQELTLHRATGHSELFAPNFDIPLGRFSKWVIRGLNCYPFTKFTILLPMKI